MLDAAQEQPISTFASAHDERSSRASCQSSIGRMIAFDTHRDKMNDVLAIVHEGAMIGNQMNALSRLMHLSLNDAERDRFDQVIEEFYLAVDVMQTMAARLEALETQADARFQNDLEAER